MKSITIALFVITSISYSQEGWIWQNPLPQGNNMSDLQFVNATTAYALCFNSVMKSTNAGSNWNIYYTKQDQSNASMHFVNVSTGFIVSDTGIVIKTTNGGVNWNVIYDFNQKRFHRIYFADINTGYLLRYNKLYNYEGTLLYRTTSGGLQWNQIISDTTFTIEGLNFPGDQTGFLAGYSSTPDPNTFYAKFFRSTNNGSSWDSVSSPLYTKFYDCKFINANTGIAYGEKVFSTYKSLYTTTNGGVNWMPSDIARRIYDVSNKNPNSLLLITTNHDIFRSTNGGLNWSPYSQFPYFTSGGTSIESFEFINSLVGVGVGYTGIITKSTNSGLNWTSQFNNNNANWIWEVDFVNENTGYAADVFHLLKTTNAGNNWNIVFTHGLYHLDFVDANTGYFGGEDSLFKTTNGGLTISQVHYTNSPGVLNEIQFLNANTGFILGKYNITWKTTNGGVSWNILSGYGSGYHECLFFYNESLGFIGRDDLNSGWGISRTTNGGVNWDFQKIPMIHYYILDIFFINETTGYFTTRNQIFKTINTGNNWVSVYNYDNDYITIDIFALNFVNNSVGYAAVTNGKVLKTINAGNTWNIHNSITNCGFYDLSFTDENTGYFVGSGGVILKTTNGGGSTISIQPISNTIPNEFKLFQNYPNPFNPTTNIKFAIPQPETNTRSVFTGLTIYDILGRKIDILLNEELAAGVYEIEWNAVKYPSGVYFVKLTSGNRTITGKIILLK